jgi:hypothetical protein
VHSAVIVLRFVLHFDPTTKEPSRLLMRFRKQAGRPTNLTFPQPPQLQFVGLHAVFSASFLPTRYLHVTYMLFWELQAVSVVGQMQNSLGGCSRYSEGKGTPSVSGWDVIA